MRESIGLPEREFAAQGRLLRLAAFSSDPEGGNPAGVWIGETLPSAAAAALGGYLREANLVSPPVTILVKQGDDIGRPSRLTVEIPASGGIVVKGTAVSLGVAY